MERCPYLRVIRAGDESQDYCFELDMLCVLVRGEKCVEYEDFLKESNQEGGESR